jgi:dehydrogenase/reductase SDR family member 12
VTLARMVDAAIEAPIAPSFTNIGFGLRSRLEHWTPLQSYNLRGRTVVVTGATSGLGRNAVEQLALLGAHVVISGRDVAKAERVRHEVAATTRSTELSVSCADMGELDQVRTMADDLLRAHSCIDVLIHNAGALATRRSTNGDGVESTIASQVLGPFALTGRLLGALSNSRPGRVLTMSSGGMYASALSVDRMQMTDDNYRASVQYARAKRAQVTLNEMWAQRVDPSEIVFQAMHPGWADTPGIEGSLPTFHRLVKPLLRTPSQGADTLIWLASDDGEPLRTTGGFWLDRKRRNIHRLPSTRRSDTPEQRVDLWNWCVAHDRAR